VNHVTAALLDLGNLVGGLLLAAVLLAELPRVGPGIARAAAVCAPAAAVVGVLALVMGGYYLILHLAGGPHVFHFELVGIAVGVALLRHRLFPAVSGRTTATRSPAGPSGPGAPPAASGPSDLFQPAGPAAASGPPYPPGGSGPASAPTAAYLVGPIGGAALLLAVFGLIAVVVGIQGLFTPDG
jgi:hypothetical protein